MSRRQRVVLLGLAVVLPLIVWSASRPVLLWSATAENACSALRTPPRITEHRRCASPSPGTPGPVTQPSAQRHGAWRRRAAMSLTTLVLLGDLVYEDGEARLTDSRVTKPFAPVLDRRSCCRSSETTTTAAANSSRSWRRGPPGSWYSQRITGPGPVLDSNRVDDPEQNRWLRRTLAEPQPAGTWTLAAMHHPAYSAGYHGSDLQVRDAWGPLFAQAGVRLALAGHDHDYQRSSPQQGVTYVVSGRRRGCATPVPGTSRW